mgnify:CR=1 FL=1
MPATSAVAVAVAVNVTAAAVSPVPDAVAVTLCKVEPLARQPDPAPYLGTYTRPGNSVVVRAEGGKAFVGQPAVSFYGPDRVVVLDGADRGQSIEFVRDAGGRVTWIRVVGRVAVRTP